MNPRVKAEPRWIGAGLALGLAAALLPWFTGGCAHGPAGEGSAPSAEDSGGASLTPFLLGPISLLFTNVGGFGARVTVEHAGTAARGPRTVVGDLYGRSGQLAFVPTGADSRARRGVSVLIFLWDASTNGGYLLSEALQGYATVTAPAVYTNLVTQPASPAPGGMRIDGHPCVLSDVTVSAADGTASAFRVWRATDLSDLPLQIVAPRDGGASTVRLSKARLEAPPEDLFAVPAGFTKYESLDVMVAELRLRQRSVWQGGDRPKVPADSLAAPGRAR